MRPYHVCGLGNAIVDIFIEVTDAEFASLQFERGTMRLVEADEQKQLLDKLSTKEHELRLVSGGSVANSIIGLSQLGGRVPSSAASAMIDTVFTTPKSSTI